MSNKKSKEFNFITVQIGDYAYDYPKICHYLESVNL